MKQYFSLEAKLITVLTSPDYQMIHARAMLQERIKHQNSCFIVSPSDRFNLTLITIARPCAVLY